MRRILWHWIISAGALWLTVSVHPLAEHIQVLNPWNVLWIAPLLGLVNMAVGIVTWLISLIAFPITLLTLGCFGFLLSFILYTVAVYGLFGPGAALCGYMKVDTLLWAAALSAVMALFFLGAEHGAAGEEEKK